MTAQRNTDRLIATWLTEVAPERHVDYLGETLLSIDAIGQRPAWASPAWWLPSQLTRHRVALPRLAPMLVILALLLVAMLVAVAIVGSRPRLPAPYGLAATGLVAFESGGDIVATLPDGSGRRTLIGDPGAQWGQVWSHRGDRFAYWSAPGLGEPASLFVASADGRNRQLITGSETFFVADYLPGVNWSPDDLRLVFGTDAEHGANLYVVGADGNDLHSIGDNTHRRNDPVWSPDGTLIAYRGLPLGEAQSSMSSWVITPDGVTDTLVIPAGPASLEWSNVNPSWSPDGHSFLVDTGPSDNNDITIAERAPNGTWTHRAIVGGPESDGQPAWSTSGTQFSFVRLAGVGDSELYDLMVADADGTNVHSIAPVNTGLAAQAVQCWSPDDRFIRMSGPREWGPSRTILLIPVDGSPAVEIATPGEAGNAVCQLQRIAP